MNFVRSLRVSSLAGVVGTWLALVCLVLSTLTLRAQSASAGSNSHATTLVLNPPGRANGKHIVLVSGDEHFRSEEALPMLAKILSQRHGFKCTVLFALDPDGTINPSNDESLAGAEALDSADAVVLSVRKRNWPDAIMSRFVGAFRRGVPVIALRTSLHGFGFKQGSYQKFNDFGWDVLGEYSGHWGKGRVEATRGVIEAVAANHPVLRGVTEVFGPGEVYEVRPAAGATVLLRGLVLQGSNPDDPPATHSKKRLRDKLEQPVNDPTMPLAWVREHPNEGGITNRIFYTSMGGGLDFLNEGLRRLVVNSVYWGVGFTVPAQADVRFVDPYTPGPFLLKGYRVGLRPADHGLGKVLPAAPSAPAP
jgi:hypothetical protein